MPRVLALTTSYPLRPCSVAGVFVRRLYEKLPVEWAISVLCPDDAMGRNQEEKHDRIHLHPIRYAPKRWRLLSQVSGGIAASLRTDRRRVILVPLLLMAIWWRCLRMARHADVIHANWAICGALAVSASWLVRRPVVTTFRGDDVASAGRSRFARYLLELSLKGSRCIVCVSDAMADDLRLRYPEYTSKILVCRNGVEDAFLQVHHGGVMPDKLRIVAVGSLIKRKGFDVLVDAISRIHTASGVVLKIAGDGPEHAALLAQAKDIGVAEHLSIVGELPPDAIPEFLVDADVFVLSSRSEGRPNVVVEALAAGLPVISSDLPGVKDLVKSGCNGWLVPVDDAQALASALDEARSDFPGLIAMGVNARSGIIASGETWAWTAARYAVIFGNAIDASRVDA